MNSLDYYEIEELLTDEERAIRDRATQFVQKEVLSEIVPRHRAGKFPDHLIPRMGALRFYAPYPKEYTFRRGRRVRFRLQFSNSILQPRQRLRNRRRLTNNSYFESSASSAL